MRRGGNIKSHPERANKREPRDLARANRARARCEYAEPFLCKMLLCVHWSATLLLRSRCGAQRLAICSFGKALTSQISTSRDRVARFAQDDAKPREARVSTRSPRGEDNSLTGVAINLHPQSNKNAQPFRLRVPIFYKRF